MEGKGDGRQRGREGRRFSEVAAAALLAIKADNVQQHTRMNHIMSVIVARLPLYSTQANWPPLHLLAVAHCPVPWHGRGMPHHTALEKEPLS